jgi:hypothetical protein
MSSSRQPHLSKSDADRLVEEINRSPAFRGTSRTNLLLKILLEHRDGPPLSTKDLAERLYEDAPSHEHSSDKIRMLMSRLRQTLHEYNLSDGRRAAFKIELPMTRGGYQLQVEPNVAWRYDVSSFWEPYSDSSPVDIVIPQLLVFKQPEKNALVRYQDINNSGDIMSKTGRGNKKAIKGTPSYSYVSAGEVRAAFLMADMLREKGLKTNLSMIAESSFFDGFRNSNLVVLGDPRANPLLRLIEDRMKFRSLPNGVTDTAAGPKAKSYLDSDDGDHPNNYVLLTRRHRTGPHGAVATAFASTNGNAIAAIVAAIGEKEMMRRIVDEMSADGEGGLPSSFQVLFDVRSFRGFGEEHVAGECKLVETIAAKEL